MPLILFLIALASCPPPAARAAEEPLPEVEAARSLLRSAELSRPSCPAPVPEADDPPGAEGCVAPRGSGLDDDPAADPPAASLSTAAINTGFKALGGAGQKGTVDGPGFKGNGTYKVLKNGSFEVQLEIKTGYMDTTLRLTRDPKTGKDTLHGAGKEWNSIKGAWGPFTEGTFEAQFLYDAKADAGKIRYKEKGQWKKEGYRRGKAGRTSMVIEFGGGWDHVFRRD